MNILGNRRDQKLFWIIPLLFLLFSLLLPLPGFMSWAETGLLTIEERKWLKAHPVIRVAPDPNFPPIEFFDENDNFKGIVADYIALIEKRFDIRFEIVRFKNWNEAKEKLKNGQADVLSTTTKTEERAEYMLFTNPYLELPSVIIAGGKINETLTLEKLRGMKVAVVSGYLMHEILKNKETGIVLDVVPNVAAGLKKVSFGMADAFIGNLPSISYYIEREGITNLRVAGETGYFNRLSFASRKDWPELSRILEKALSGISRNEKEEIHKRWIHLDKMPVFSKKEFKVAVVFIFVMFVLTVAGIIIWKNGSLKRQIEKRTEELRLTEEKYRNMFENAVEGIFQSTPEGRFINVNPAMARMYGYESPEDMMENITDIPQQLYVNPEGRKVLSETLEEKGVVEGLEIEEYRKDGVTIWVSLFARGIRDSDGKILYYEGISEDITERKAVEELLKIQTSELANAKERAEEADRLKSAFLATMSHELRTPLNSILGFSGIIAQGLSGPLNDEQKKQMGMIQNSARHLLELINDVLDISKIEAGKVEMQYDIFDMQALVNETVKAAVPLAEKKGLHIESELAPEIGQFFSDRRRVKQILVNLINNAIKFTDKGEVHIGCRVQDNMLVTSVSDTGIGINEEDMNELFKPFQQVDTGISRRHEGTGLGLSICKRLVEMLGGIIRVESRPGVGSSFTFSLPIQHNRSGNHET